MAPTVPRFGETGSTNKQWGIEDQRTVTRSKTIAATIIAVAIVIAATTATAVARRRDANSAF
jgi:hypothetical protein